MASPFYKLPLELRENIYSQYFEWLPADIESLCLPEPGCLNPHTAKALAVLRVDRRMRQEILNFFARTRQFELDPWTVCTAQSLLINFPDASMVRSLSLALSKRSWEDWNAVPGSQKDAIMRILPPHEQPYALRKLTIRVGFWFGFWLNRNDITVETAMQHPVLKQVSKLRGLEEFRAYATDLSPWTPVHHDFCYTLSKRLESIVTVPK